MENQTPLPAGADPENIFSISYDVASLDHLRKLSLWARITSVCAFVTYIFSLITAFFGHQPVALPDENSAAVGLVMRSSNIAGTILVVIIGGIINYFLYRFAVSVGQGARNIDSLKVNIGFDNLRLYFKTIGILLIIALGIVVLAVLISLLTRA